MTTLTASEARAGLYRLIDQTAETHKPVLISGKRSNAVLISEEDWSAMTRRMNADSGEGSGGLPDERDVGAA